MSKERKSFETMAYQAHPANVPAGWSEAYTAFQRAFDNPLQRQLHNDEFARDARARMREINEAMLAAAQGAAQPAQADVTDASLIELGRLWVYSVGTGDGPDLGGMRKILQATSQPQQGGKQ